MQDTITRTPALEPTGVNPGKTPKTSPGSAGVPGLTMAENFNEINKIAD
jgi:hypothetical protein